MQMSDTRQIAATPAEVYAALLDPEMLQTCVPGAQDVTGSVEAVSYTHLTLPTKRIV